MHYHLEVILPPVEDVNEALAHILEPFNSCAEDEDFSRHKFWDFWTIGGRYSGAKVKNSVSNEELEKFNDELIARKITVSSLQFGKQELHPASQIPIVNALWQEFFPGKGDVCPLFAHYKEEHVDIVTLKDMPLELEAYHTIIAGFDYEGKLRAETMLQCEIWNGVSHQQTTWNGKVQSAIDYHNKGLENSKPEHKEKNTPTDDWLVVTVDYHN